MSKSWSDILFLGFNDFLPHLNFHISDVDNFIKKKKKTEGNAYFKLVNYLGVLELE